MSAEELIFAVNLQFSNFKNPWKLISNQLSVIINMFNSNDLD